MRALIICENLQTAEKISSILGPTIDSDICTSMEDALSYMRSVKYGLFFIDISVFGAEPCHIIRKHTSAPVIFISPNYNEAEAVAGFDAGADDYLSQPFGMLELCGRVRAILRRCESHGACRLEWIDEHNRTVTINGEKVHLSNLEFSILIELARANGNPVSKNTIIRDVWGFDSYATDDALKVRINSLRKKIGENSIETVRGYGYRLVSQK